MEKELFLKALWLVNPWYVKEFKLDIENKKLDIYLDFEKWSKFINNDWDLVWVEQTQNRTWKHLFFWQYTTYLHCRVPKLKNKEWKVNIIEVPWSRKWSWFTLLFESFILEFSKHMPLISLAKQVKENDKRLMNIVEYYVDKSKGKADYSKIKKWCIDETSRAKWHSYISSFINFETRKVSSIVEWKWKESVEQIAKDIELHWWDRNNIEEISIDFSPSFTAWVKESFPNAQIVYDKFHFMQFINKALDEVRKDEVRLFKEDKENKEDKDLLKWNKFLFLRNEKDLWEKSKIELEKLKLKLKNKNLWEAYQMKENIREFFEKDNLIKAELFLNYWCEWVLSSSIEPMKKVVGTIKKHWSWIMKCIETEINNWIIEWINSTIQWIKKRWRWYRNIKNFMTMIYLKLWDFEICQG